MGSVFSYLIAKIKAISKEIADNLRQEYTMRVLLGYPSYRTTATFRL